MRSLLPVAQYVRMSTDMQEFSVENQKAAIAAYSRRNNLKVVKEYEDLGESGVSLKHRTGLCQLLADVLGGQVQYKQIVVLDVSRWGRFQDADEAAHYEFVCKKAGVPVVYCAETFRNEGTIGDYFAKVIKRAAAAEYSRELSIKSFDNHKRTVQLGFRVGSEPGYGWRRMCVASNGQHKKLLKTGEYKSLLSDRVTLVHGPRKAVQCVRLIFALRLKRLSFLEIARELNRRGIKKAGRNWKAWMIDDIITNPKYAGTYVWNKTTQQLASQSKANKAEKWISKPNAFPPIVSQVVFQKAQTVVSRTNHRSDQELVTLLKRLLAKKGYLSERLIQTTRGMPSVATYHHRLGTFEAIYKLASYAPPPGRFVRCSGRQQTQALRAGLFRQLATLFPGTTTFHQVRKMRNILQLNDLTLSVILCRSILRPRRAPAWSLFPVPAESRYMTLICRLNSANDGFHSFYLFPRMNKAKPIRFTEEYPWLSEGERLNSLEELLQVAQYLHNRGSSGGTSRTLTLKCPMEKRIGQ
jgi:DNA invertase Pin-like site-specific DNA recombinase